MKGQTTRTIRNFGIERDMECNHGDLPSVGRHEGGPASMTNDTTEVVRVVSALLDQGKKVILLTHSYGGFLGTQSLERVSRKAREAEGRPGGVKKMIYLAAVIVQVGTSSLEAVGSDVPDFFTLDGDYMYLIPERTAPLTFSDQPLEDGLALAREMPDHSLTSLKEKLTYPGYNGVEAHYIVCQEDKVLLPELQYGIIDNLKSLTGRDINVHKLRSGHMPTNSQPDNLAEIVARIV
ncbi:hypothetical protein ACJZ2D_001406 [Fusarium nematophilum]